MVPTLLQIILLGLVQGAAELLPVSSSAHVIAAEKLMHLDPSQPEMTFLLVMLHTGTMFAVILYFWDAWRRRFFSSRRQAGAVTFRLAVATVATGIVALGLKLLIEKVVLHGRPKAEVEDLFGNLPLIAFSLAAAGLLILWSGLRVRGLPPRTDDPSVAESFTPGAAALVGILQGVCLPFRGFSRSGATISAAMLADVPRRAAEEFSFALGVILTPAVIVQEMSRLYRARVLGGSVPLLPLAVPGLVGMVASFGAGLLALRWLSVWLEHGRWHYFGVYCLAAAAGVGLLAHLGY